MKISYAPLCSFLLLSGCDTGTIGGPRQTLDPSVCLPETDAVFCARLDSDCGELVARDNCGVSRTVASCGTCDLPATCGGAGPPNLCGEPGTLVNPAPGIGFFVGANFWRIDWEGWENYFVPDVDWATVENPWRPDFLVDLAPYRVLRFMDWNLTNDLDNPQAHWSTRKQKTSSQLNEPIAFEWQIDLCNRAYKDYWITVPPEAEPSDWTELAELIYATLDPSLRVYVEWANEVWNGAFPVSEYAYERASALGLPGNDGSLSYQAYQSVRLFEAFDAVFGETNPRLVRVISGQAAWTGVFEDLKDALADLTINPNATRPDFFAIAPYVHGTSIAELSEGLATAISWTASSYDCANEGGFPLISYEGGTDSYSGDCTAMQHDEGIYDIYTGYLDGLVSSQMTGPFMQYTHSGECWGLKENTSDTLGVSPKYRAVTDWLVAHP